MKTVLLLICSNIFMTVAWYGHLKYRKSPLVAAIVVSWLIAFVEYCFQVPANRIGYAQFSAFQLKIIQEVVGNSRTTNRSLPASRSISTEENGTTSLV